MTHSSSRRFALRDRTAEAHAALDAAVGALASLDAYGRYLRGLDAFRPGLEDRLAGSAWQVAPLAPLIAADMRDLGVASRRGPAPPAADDEAERIGLAYLLEGSALGARLLQRQALGLGLTPERGARHLAAQTAGLAAWHAFCARLEAAPAFDLDRAAAAANRGFAAALRGFGPAA